MASFEYFYSDDVGLKPIEIYEKTKFNKKRQDWSIKQVCSLINAMLLSAIEVKTEVFSRNNILSTISKVWRSEANESPFK